jgi:hypothetical protein
MSGADLIALLVASASLITAAVALQDSRSKRKAASRDRQVWRALLDDQAGMLAAMQRQWEILCAGHDELLRLVNADLDWSSAMAAAYRGQKEQFLDLMRGWAKRTAAQWQQWLVEFSPGQMTGIWAEIAADTEQQARETQSMLPQSQELLDRLRPRSLSERLGEIAVWINAAQEHAKEASAG